jgi:hypothetical protein
MGRGVGGRGRLNEEGIWFAVDAYEYVGEAGTGGSLLGVGEGERDRTEEDILFVYFLLLIVRCRVRVWKVESVG